MKLHRMKIKYVIGAGLVVAGLLFVVLGNHAARAQVVPLINFIGKVTNLDGGDVPDGAYDFRFRLYSSPSGGTVLWSENLASSTRFSATVSSAISTSTGLVITYSGESATSTLRAGQYLSTASSSVAALIIDYDTDANTITVASSSLAFANGDRISNRPFVEGGVINENLGTVSDLSGVDFSQTLYLEIIFNGETMQPRKILTTVPAAFDTMRFGGKTEDEFATLSENEAITGEWNFNNIVSVATSSNVAALSVTQNGSGNIVEFNKGTTTAFAVLADGRVQIGNYRFPIADGAPGYILKTDGSGNLGWAVDFAGNFGIEGRTLWATSSDESSIFPIDSQYIVIIGNNTTTSLTGQIFEVNGLSVFDTVSISSGQPLRLYDADNSNYIAWRASSSIPSNLVLTLPDSYGAPNSALITDGNGNLRWGSPSSFVYVNPGNRGQLSYYAADGSALSATSSIFISQAGYVGIGTTTPGRLLTVGNSSGSQFLVNGSGQVVGGEWQSAPIGAAYGGTGTTSAWWTGIPFVAGGSWSPTSTLAAAYGGTGINSYSEGDLLYAGPSGSLARLGVGANGKVLAIVGGVPQWSATTSLGLDLSEIPGILPVNQGGTGQNFAGETGFVYLDNGIASASSTIAISFTNLSAGTGLEFSNNILRIDPTGDWTGSFDGFQGVDFFTLSAWYATTTDALAEGSINRFYHTYLFAADLAATTTDALGEGAINRYYHTNLFAADLAGTSTDAIAEGLINRYYHTYLFAADLAATTTDALTEGSNNIYWHDYLFDIRLAATTSLPNLTTLENLATVGTISAGTWEGDVIDVAHGGTGTSTFEAYSLVYASADDTISQILPGPNGYALVMQSGQPVWASTSPGTTHDLLSSMHPDTTEATVLRGALITGQGVSPSWSLLALGANGSVVYSDGTDLVWQDYEALFAAQLAATTTDALSEGSVNRYYHTNLFATDLAATTTDALTEGGNNIYWHDYLFDARLAGTSTLPNLTTLENLSTVGTISAGTWEGDVIDVAHGGTGLSVITNQSLLYASADDIISQFAVGPEGTVLAIVGGDLTWATTSAPSAHSLLSVSHSDVAATSTLVRGDLLVANSNDKWSRLALGAAGYILYSNGTDAYWSTTTAITALGTISSGIWEATPIAVEYGGTGADNATSARANLGLSDIERFGINSTGTPGWLWMSDGDGRGHWVPTSTLNIDVSGQQGKFIGTTTVTTTGSIATTTYIGYQAANRICAFEYTGSHMCRTYEILVTIEQDSIADWNSDDAWIAEGPPGYTSNSNDCNGWTDGSLTALGAFWVFDRDGGGAGWLVNCSNYKPIACCSWQ